MDSNKNAAVSSKFKLWFTEIYELGDELKAYIEKEKIHAGQILSVEQGLVIIDLINKIDGLRLTIARACMVARKKPELFSKSAAESNENIGKAFKIIDDTLFKKYEKEARESLEKYIESRKGQVESLAFDGELKLDNMISEKELLTQLKDPSSKPMDKKFKARARWHWAIHSVIDQNRKKNKAWANVYETVQNYYERVDAEVKDQVRDHAKEEYQALIKLHEHFIKWLDIFEEVMRLTETDIKSLSGNMDDIANKRAKMVQMIIRGSVSGALSPLFLSGFIDPAIAAVNSFITSVMVSQGNVSLTLSAQTIYSLTGFLPDPNKTTYKDAYNKLLSESIYEKIARYKKYLRHKIDSLSETTEFSDMMSDESRLWGDYTADMVIKAHRMAIIDAGHYEYSEVHLAQPENKDSLINNMTKPFAAMVNETFSPMRSQYGTKENLKSLHTLLDNVTFDNDRAGPEANNHQHETSLIKYLSSHLSIYFMVKFLVENSVYFGGKNHGTRLQHEHCHLDENDDSYGLYADDAAIEELVAALVKRIATTDNEGIKSILELDDKKPLNDQVKSCLLNQYSHYSRARYRMMHYGAGCFFSSTYAPDSNHQKRRTMVQALVNEYYNQDISEILQRYTVKFAQKLNITLGDPSHDSQVNHDKIIDPKWISENDLKNLVDEKIKPFMNETDENIKMRGIFGSGGMSYYRNARLTLEAKHLRAIETGQEFAESNKKKVKFNS